MLSKNKIKKLTKLHSKKYRQEYGQYLIEGVHSVEEAIKDAPRLVEEVFAWPSVIGRLDPDLDVTPLRTEELKKISLQKSPEGVIALMNMPEAHYWDYEMKSSLFYLDDIQNPSNLGTIIRTLDWFGYEALLLSANSVEEYNPKAVQSSMGSIHRVKIYREGVDFTQKKLADEFPIYITDMQGTNYKDFAPDSKQIILMGNESHGVSDYWREVAEGQITILGKGGAESLNIATAQGILASHFLS